MGFNGLVAIGDFSISGKPVGTSTLLGDVLDGIIGEEVLRLTECLTGTMAAGESVLRILAAFSTPFFDPLKRLEKEIFVTLLSKVIFLGTVHMPAGPNFTSTRLAFTVEKERKTPGVFKTRFKVRGLFLFAFNKSNDIA